VYVGYNPSAEPGTFGSEPIELAVHRRLPSEPGTRRIGWELSGGILTHGIPAGLAVGFTVGFPAGFPVGEITGNAVGREEGELGGEASGGNSVEFEASPAASVARCSLSRTRSSFLN